MFNLNQSDNIIALMIDGDNVASDYIDFIEQEASITGRVTHKRLYYTYNSGIPNGWGDKINSHALNPVHVMPYTNGKSKTVKNVADAALIIGAMDIKNSVNTVIIVASDSDYTVLVKRLKEDGIYLIGMGDKNTPPAFIKACDEFKYLEKLKEKYSTETVETADGAPQSAKDVKAGAENAKAKAAQHAPAENSVDLVPKKEIEKYIIGVFENQNKNILDSGFIYNAIRRQYPSFDHKDYGAKKFPDFFDPTIFTVIYGKGEKSNVNIQYPAAKTKAKTKQENK